MTGVLPLGFKRGDILVAPRFHVAWSFAMMTAAGVVLEQEERGGAAHFIALQHEVALIVSVPNAGQFIEGEQLYLFEDGRLAVATQVAHSPV